MSNVNNNPSQQKLWPDSQTEDVSSPDVSASDSADASASVSAPAVAPVSSFSVTPGSLAGTSVLATQPAVIGSTSPNRADLSSASSRLNGLSHFRTVPTAALIAAAEGGMAFPGQSTFSNLVSGNNHFVAAANTEKGDTAASTSSASSNAASASSTSTASTTSAGGPLSAVGGAIPTDLNSDTNSLQEDASKLQARAVETKKIGCKDRPVGENHLKMVFKHMGFDKNTSANLVKLIRADSDDSNANERNIVASSIVALQKLNSGDTTQTRPLAADDLDKLKASLKDTAEAFAQGAKSKWSPGDTKNYHLGMQTLDALVLKASLKGGDIEAIDAKAKTPDGASPLKPFQFVDPQDP